MDREQIRRRWEALKSAWAALKGPEAFLGEHFAHEDDVQAALEAVENDVDALLAAIDELEVRNAKLEAVAVFMKKRGRKVSDCEAVKTTYVDRRPRFRYCGRCPMCKVWAALDALDG